MALRSRVALRVLSRIPNLRRGKFPILNGENSRAQMRRHRARGVAAQPPIEISIPPVEIYSGLPPIEIQTWIAPVKIQKKRGLDTPRRNLQSNKPPVEIYCMLNLSS